MNGNPPSDSVVGTTAWGRGDVGTMQNGRLKYFRRRVRPLEYQAASIPPIELDDLER